MSFLIIILEKERFDCTLNFKLLNYWNRSDVSLVISQDAEASFVNVMEETVTWFWSHLYSQTIFMKYLFLMKSHISLSKIIARYLQSYPRIHWLKWVKSSKTVYICATTYYNIYICNANYTWKNNIISSIRLKKYIFNKSPHIYCCHYLWKSIIQVGPWWYFQLCCENCHSVSLINVGMICLKNSN